MQNSGTHCMTVELLARQVKEVYYAELDSLLKKVTGATRVYVMGHGFRRGKVQKE